MDRLIPDNLVSRLNTLEGFLRSNILGQDEVLGEIVALLQRGFCELRFPNRPVASMLFLGPTGVGKTETCNLLTRHLFGSDDKLIRLDMSEYQEQRSIGVLLGPILESVDYWVIIMTWLFAPACFFLMKSRVDIASIQLRGAKRPAGVPVGRRGPLLHHRARRTLSNHRQIQRHFRSSAHAKPAELSGRLRTRQETQG